MTHLFGKFVWFECVTDRPEQAKRFYGELFGWKIQSFPMGEGSYEMIAVGDTLVGGYAAPKNGSPPHWTSYLSVEDVDAAAAEVVAAGGEILEKAFEVPQVGRMAKLADPEGASFWVMRGAEDAPDAPPSQGRFFWNELWARDGKRAASFYEKIFGYARKETPMPDGLYHVLEKDGVPRAGVMTSPVEQVPPMWLPYVAVDDCDATVARAKKLGGKVHAEPADIPEVGRFAVLADPFGATIAVITPASG